MEVNCNLGLDSGKCSISILTAWIYTALHYRKIEVFSREVSFSQRGRSLKENITIIAVLFCGRFCAICEKETKSRKKEIEIRAPIEKNVSVFNNVRSSHRGRYLETARFQVFFGLGVNLSIC